MNIQLFDQFVSVLKSESPPVVRDGRLLMDSDEDVSIYYAPFEYINPAARIVLVGITPGPTQMVNAVLEARRQLLKGATAVEAIEAAKKTAAFSGEPLRGNLVTQLNHWGFPEWLGIRDSSELFEGLANLVEGLANLVQTTSLLRYPTFVHGKDYAGTSDMTNPRNELLRQHLFDYFAKEVNEMKHALFVSLGPKVQAVLDFLAKEGVVDENRLIRGMLHPSGNNTYRIAYLVGDRQASEAPYRTNPFSYDQGRTQFRERYLKVKVAA